MAKSKKTEEAEKLNDVVETTSDETTETVNEPISVPDIPEQIEAAVEVVEEEVEQPESDEILFLRTILERQHSGGFGRHLDGMINERINYLKSK